MKKIVLLLCAALLLTLCACGGGGTQTGSAAPAESAAPVESAAPAENAEPAPAASEAAPAEEAPVPAEESAVPEDAAPSLREIAEGFIGKDVEELIAEIGEPEVREYQDSCEKPDTQDGFLDYEGFTVVTAKTGGQELVQRIDNR